MPCARRFRFEVPLAALVAIAGCGETQAAPPVDGGLLVESTDTACTDRVDNDHDGYRDCDDPSCGAATACAPARDAGHYPFDGNLEACATLVEQGEPAFAPVDVIWIVDSSGSMHDEATRVQENINAFARGLESATVDYRVIVITSALYLTVPEPLGSSPRFLFIDQFVASHEALLLLLDLYDRYGDFLRSNALTHFVVTTDDESRLSAEAFLPAMEAKLGHSFVAHAIASPMVEPTFLNPAGACRTGAGELDGAIAPGLEYYQLANLTGGLTLSICSTDWGRLFDRLTERVAVRTRVACGFVLPAPPSGMVFDRNLVNVILTRPDGTREVLPYRPSPSGGGCDGGGWYYDYPPAPSQVVLCAESCERAMSIEGARIEIAFGCQTFI